LSDRPSGTNGFALRMALFGAACGAAYGTAVSSEPALGALRGALVGFIVAGTLAALERFAQTGERAARLRRLSFARLLAIRTLAWFAVIVLAQEVGSLLLPIGTSRGIDFGDTFRSTTLLALAFSLVVNFVMQVSRLLGQGELVRFLLGRYHRPREEERVFLFMDLVGSTAIAERIGGVRYLELLNDLYARIAAPITAPGGEIHKYVGDEVIVTWTPARGLAQAGCLACALSIEAVTARCAEELDRRYGVAPRFRLALHLGPVVSGELGTIKKEIAYLGDTVNTTERIMEAARASGRDAVASGALLARAELPRGVEREALGPVQLRGKSAAVELFALRLDPSSSAAAPAVLG
jgi:adenylate cyclase